MLQYLTMKIEFFCAIELIMIYWNLPGGVLEHGEAPWECVIREVKEETGFDVKIEKLSGIYSKPTQNEIVFQYICTVIGGGI